MRVKFFRYFIVILVLLCGSAKAACIPSEVITQGSGDITARVTTMLGQNEIVVEIVQPKGLGAACLIFRNRGESDKTGGIFELELLGQLGLHVVTLNRDYLVVESGTANGSFVSEIFALQAGHPVRLAAVGSSTPPNFVKRGRRDYVLTTGDAGKQKRTAL